MIVLDFPLKLDNETVKQRILEFFPKANFEHIERQDNKGVIKITGIEENTTEELKKIIEKLSNRAPDVKLKCEIKKIIKPNELKRQTNTVNFEDDLDLDDDEVEEKTTLDFNTLLNQQINSHVSSAKKEIKKLYSKLKTVVEQYNNNTGNIENNIDKNKNSISEIQDSHNSLSELMTENISEIETTIESNKKDMLSKHEELLERVSKLEIELSNLVSTISKSVEILKNIK